MLIYEVLREKNAPMLASDISQAIEKKQGKPTNFKRLGELLREDVKYGILEAKEGLPKGFDYQKVNGRVFNQDPIVRLMYSFPAKKV